MGSISGSGDDPRSSIIVRSSSMVAGPLSPMPNYRHGHDKVQDAARPAWSRVGIDTMASAMVEHWKRSMAYAKALCAQKSRLAASVYMLPV
jgi:hypothetical protein